MPINNRTLLEQVNRRLNFFTGFFTTADDWLQGQEYHLEKRRLHLRGLHTAGIIPGEGEALKVTAGGGLAVRVGPGAALDREGNLLYLSAAKTIPITLPEGLPKAVYIYISYAEAQPTPITTSTIPNTAVRHGSPRIPKLLLRPMIRAISMGSCLPASYSNQA